SLFADSEGDLWIGSISPDLNGLSRWKRSGQTLQALTEADGLPSRNVLPTAFGEDRDRDLWVGFSTSGLGRYRAGRFTIFTTADGVPEGWVRAVFCDHNGRLWVSGGQNGVRRIDNPQAPHPSFVAYSVAQGLS